MTGTSYDDFIDVKKKVSLPAGKHTLRLDVTAQYFDIDYINFTKGTSDEPPIAIQTQIRYEYPEVSDYYVFDVNGVRIGRMSAYTMDEAVTTLKNSSAIKVQGIYMLRSVKNGEVKSVRVAR